MHAETENSACAASRMRFTPSSLLARNATLSLLTYAWVFVVLIVATPKLVFYLGETAFGLFSLAWIAIGYLGLLDIGVNRAATKFVAEHVARQDHESAGQILQTGVLVNLCMGVSGGLVVAAAAHSLAHSVFKISAELQGEAQMAFYAVAAAIPVLLVQGIFRAVLSSFQMFGWINGVEGAGTTAQWGIAWLLAWKGMGPSIVVWWSVAVRIGMAGVYAYVLWTLFPDLHPWRARRLHRLRELISFGGWVSVSQIASPLLLYADRFLIASWVSLSAVTLYSVPFEAMSRLRILPSCLMAALYPAFSERGMAGHQRGQLQRLYQRSLQYLLMVLIPGSLYLCVLGPDLFGLWMGSSFAQQTTAVVRILALGVLANALAPLPYDLLQALGRPDLTGKFHLLEVPLQLLLCVLLIPHWGLNGAAVACTFRLAFDSVLLFWAAGKYCGCSFGHSREYAKLLTPSVLLAAVLMVVNSVVKYSIARLGAGAVAVAMCLLASWCFSIDSDEKPRITGVFKSLLGEAAS